MFFFLSIISLVPVFLSPLYYSTFTFFEYLFLGLGFPYSTAIWCMVRAIPSRRPILRMNLIVISYVFIHIPLILFMINSLEFITTDANTIATINNVIIGTISFTLLCGIISIVVWLIKSVRDTAKDEEEDDTVKRPVDYYYH